MKIVYVIGSGASFSDKLHLTRKDVTRPVCSPPMIGGFFSATLLEQLQRDPFALENEFPEMVEYIRRFHLQRKAGPFGTGAWLSLNLEDVFTAVEIDREFYPPTSTHFARLQIVRNEITDYIRMVIGLCTRGASGSYTESLVGLIHPNDSILTFNWDLLLDTALGNSGKRHNVRFLLNAGVIDDDSPISIFGDDGGDGLFLKLHGSLNWFQCTNPGCSKEKGFFWSGFSDESALNTGINRTSFRCDRCQASMDALIVPPVLRKPIFEHDVIQSAWRLAVEELKVADAVVLIGFSAAKTDFYASWLLRTHVPSEAVVYVVNPDESPEFQNRMNDLFPQGVNRTFKRFEEIASIYKALTGQSGTVGA